MHSFKFVILKLKELILPLIISLFTIFLIVFSSDNLVSAKSGIILWANSVLPSLLPFFIATELLGHTNIIFDLGRFFEKIMRPIFNVPGEGAFILIMGIISGYPTGAKIISNFKEQGILNRIECERLLSFTNNSGPLFILGTVGASLFGNTIIGVLLLTTHILACLTVGFIFRWWKTSSSSHESNYRNLNNSNLISLSNLGEVLSKSIMSSINTVVLIGGFIMLFSVIISMLENSKLLYVFSSFIEPLLELINISKVYSARNSYRLNRTY